MKVKKKFIASLLSLCLLALMILVGCNNGGTASTNATENSNQKVDYPKKPITLIVPFAAGGGGDIGARFLSAEAEKYLGQPITIVNKPGASGWLGWTDLFAAEKDGYTLASTSDINILTGYLDPQQKRDKTVEDFAPIVCYVKDFGTISLNVNETRFANIEELIEYAKKNEVTATSGGNTALVAIMKMNDALGTKFLPVRNGGGAESLPAVMGGHVDVMFASMGETKVPAQSGQVKCIAVLSKERSEFFPNVPTIKEATGADIYSFSARGIAAPTGVDKAILDKLIEAYGKAADSDAVRDKMKEQGLACETILGDDYMKLLKEEEAELKKLAPLLGWE